MMRATSQRAWLHAAVGSAKGRVVRLAAAQHDSRAPQPVLDLDCRGCCFCRSSPVRPACRLGFCAALRWPASSCGLYNIDISVDLDLV